MKHFVKIIFVFFTFFFSFINNGKSQTFLNGDFEINTAGSDQINISNPAFNAFMSNTIAYGSFGDMDIISSATYCGLAQNGLWYTALTGTSTDAITMQLSAPLVAGTTYTISFWDRGCLGFSSGSPPIEIGVSTAPGVTGTPVYSAPIPTNGTWVQRTATFVAPVSGLYISVILSSGGLGDWTQIDNFTFVVSAVTPPVSNFIASTTTVCAGNCIAFTDASTNSPTSWNWTFPGGTPGTSTLQNPSSVCYAAPGTYAVTLSVSNASGADTLVQTSYITVNAVDNASFNYSASSYCQSGINPTPTITGTAGGTFTSTGGLSINAATGTINLIGSTAGTYTITYTTSGVCPATATASVTITTVPIATFNYAGPYCQNVADPSPTLGAGASLGTFSSTAGLSISAATGVVDLSLSTPGTYTVTNNVAASGSCPAASATATITINAIPVPVISGTTSICSGTSTTLTASGGVSYSWNTGSVIATINVSPITTTTYTVTASNGGCTATATQTITVTTVPIATFNYSGPYCQNAADPSPTLGAGASLGTFTSTAGLSINVSTGIVDLSLSTPGTYTVTNSFAASGSCPATSATATITINAVPVPVITGTTTICSGATTILTVSGGTTYNWSTGSALASTSVSPTTTTTYTVTANNGGCTTTAIQTITVTPAPINTIVDTICAGQFYTLPSGTSVSNSGTYTDTVSALGGCDSIIITNLSVNNATANAGLDTIIDYGSSTVLSASGGVSYSWSPSSGLSCTNCVNSIASPLQTTTYIVTATNSNGCTASDTVTVFVDLPPCEGSSVDLKTLIPNAFSPNEDGLNDQLCIPVNPCIVKLSLIIYDRWGEKVYEGISLDQCWDGVYRGKKLDSAVFAYYFTVVFVDGKTGTGKGNISLIK